VDSKYSYSKKKKVALRVVDNPNYYLRWNLDWYKSMILSNVPGCGYSWQRLFRFRRRCISFLAHQVAIKMMCTVLTIHVFVCRWLAERIVEIAIWSNIHHRWFARDSLEDSHYCTTEIQRVVHGYLSTMHVFDKKELAEASWRCWRRLVLAVLGGGRFSRGGLALSAAVGVGCFLGRQIQRWRRQPFSRGGGGCVAGGSRFF